MKLLSDILYGVRIQEVLGSTNVAIENMTFDSREVGKYTLFVAIKGTVADGHSFIEQAVESGALAIICERLPEERLEHVTYVQVLDSSVALGVAASNFYDNPSEHIKLVGVTGTNGKTTTTTLLYRVFRKLGYAAGLLSTVENRINDEVLKATHTTPDAISLNALLSEMVAAGCEYCFMEVSSHAVAQNRVSGIQFTGGVFTNITHDHLDYHKTFEAYLAAKKRFFDELPYDAFALFNDDDPHGEEMVGDCKAKRFSYGLNGMVDYRARIIENQFSGLVLNIDDSEVWTKLIGAFNAYNLLAVYSVGMQIGLDKMDVLAAISETDSVEGRFEYIKTPGGITAIVDYAHTPDALENVLRTVHGIRTGNETVMVVVGCGGDRDKDKRPVMASVACQFADKVILTSDNPRSEDPDAIIKDMMAGVDVLGKKKTMAITDRREAIKVACNLAVENDIILIAGKGHEKYQVVKGETLPFDDMEIVNETLKTLDK